MKQLEIERTLNRRLKTMGFIMLIFALITLVWDFIPAAESELDELLLEIEEAPAPLNPYLISFVFTSVGTFCLWIHWKKKKLLSSQIPPES